MKLLRPLAFTFALGASVLHAQQPAASAPPPAPAPLAIAGAWHGEIEAPQGKFEVGFRFARRPDGKIDFGFHMPVMRVFDAKIGPAVEEQDGRFTVPLLDIAFTLSGDRLIGTFGKAHLPMTLARGDAYTKAPVQPAAPPAPAPLWTYTLGALTFASPVVHDGIAYVGARDGKFHAVRTSDGTAVWTAATPNRIDGRAVVTGEAIYFVDGKVDLVCLARADGAEKWRTPLHDSALADGPVAENPTFNRRTATPLVVGDVVYAGSTDGGLYALDAATGTKRWRAAAGAPVFTGVTRLEDGSLLFGAMDGAVVRVDAAGRELARMKAGGSVTTTPVVIDGIVVVGCRNYMLYGFNLRDGSLAWSYSYGFSWVESTPAASDGVFYIGGSDWARVSAFDAQTGRPRWATVVSGVTWGTPALTADTVFAGVTCQRGALIEHHGGIVALDRRTGAIKWRHPMTFSDERIPFGGVAGSLAVDGDRVLAAGFDGKLIALPVN
jgi:outer membrane protein assembly factor BamB